MEGMKVKDLIEYLQTLNQEIKVYVGDSEYPAEPMTEHELTIKGDRLIIY